jgi:cold shock CspA family protein/arsenate reductase-like glutaredoxin family protein
MPNGTVKFFNAGKGYGFITGDGGNNDVFVPAASILAAGISDLKTGQRVSFDEAPDGKGPKAVNLKLLEARVMPTAAPANRRVELTESQNAAVTLYCEPSFEEIDGIVAELRAGGIEPLVVDYRKTPPTRDKLKELALLLRSSDQSLVRKYDALFSELRLDDRFISENEFWDAIVEHPGLINGPVLATPVRATICRSRDAAKSFLAPGPVSVTRKALPPGMLKFMTGQVSAAPVVPEKAARIVENKVVENKPAAIAKPMQGAGVKTADPASKVAVEGRANITGKTTLKPSVAPKPVAAKSKKITPEPKPKTKAKPKSKPEAKAKAPAKPKPKIAAKAKAAPRKLAKKSPRR